VNNKASNMNALWSVLLVCVLVDYGRAAPHISSSSRDSAVKEIDAILDKLLEKHRKSGEVSRSITLSGHSDGDSTKELMGIAHHGSTVYVVRENSESIQTFDDTTLTKTGEIRVSGLKYAGDLAASDTSDHLYLLDRYPANLVWKIDIASKTASQLITFTAEQARDQPLSISVHDGRILLTSKFSSKLFFHDGNDGSLIREFSLPNDIIPRHAVEADDGSVYVCHVASRGRKTNDGVSKFDKSGNKLATFGGQRGSDSNQFDRPNYLALKPDGGVIVADFENRRVVEVNSELTEGQVVISRQNLESRQGGDDGNPSGRPWRLAVDEGDKALYVGIASGVIQVYNF
jgi:hypothetical protein